MGDAIVDNVQAITASKQELKDEKYGPATLAKALSAFHQDGLLLLKDVIPVNIIDELNEKMCSDVASKLADPNQQFNHGIKSNLLQRPPITDSKYLSKELYFNPLLLQIANAYLGSKPTWTWLTSNVALANTGGIRQPAHKDSAYDHPQFPYFFIANIPLCDFSVENGATEFWLGSHAATSWRDQKLAETEADIKAYGERMQIGEPIPSIADWAKEERMKVRPPIQPACSKGDIMIRDLRTWHAGMPNGSGEHRIMLGLGYSSPYHDADKMSLHLPSSQKKFFESHPSNLDISVKWYTDQEFAATKDDALFDHKPSYMQ